MRGTDLGRYVLGQVRTPLAHWKCNDRKINTVVVDSMGNYQGTASATTTALSVEGHIGGDDDQGALGLDGANERVTAGAISGIKTIAFWYKQIGSLAIGRLVGDTSPVATKRIQVAIDDPKLVLSFGEDDVTINDEIFYVNGVVGVDIVTPTAWNFIVMTTATGFDAGDFVFGDIIAFGTAHGHFDNVMIWDEILTPQEIARSYNYGRGTERTYDDERLRERYTLRR